MDSLDPDRFRPPPTLTGPQVAAQAGLPVDFAKRVFRALGLPEVADDAVEFDNRDRRVLTALKLIMEQGFTDEEIIEVARTYGYGLSRIAQAEVRLFRKAILDPLHERGLTNEEVTKKVEAVMPGLLDLLAEQLDTTHRRHLAVALQQITSADVRGPTEIAAAGFVDLVGFSRLSQDLEGVDLGDLVSRFETIVVEETVAIGAHIVKMIGDAVMFVAPTADIGVATALMLVDKVEHEEGLPQARAGLDHGEVVALGGDFFGKTVNVAARLTSFANPGTVVVSKEAIDALTHEVDASHIGRPRLKGVGPIRAFKVNRYPSTQRVEPGDQTL
jgi:adenylate cyclase